MYVCNPGTDAEKLRVGVGGRGGGQLEGGIEACLKLNLNHAFR